MQRKWYDAPIVKHLPNIISVLRLIGAVAMIFTEALGLWFYILYTFCGVSDLVDGWIARMTHNESEFGAKLDSVADLMFYSVMVLKIFDELMRVLPGSLWVFIWTTVAIRIFTYIFVAIRHKKFAAMHTYMNKLTGGTMFLLPCMLLTSYMVMYSWFSCTIAFLASVEEVVIHIVRKTYDANIKSILFMRT